MTLFQPLWPTRPTEDDLGRGWELVQDARRAGPRTRREELFVTSAEAFFDPHGDPDYWERIERWAAATEAVYDAFPDDLEASALFALGHLATASRYGAAEAHHARAADVLAGILEEEPTHPGAVHYTIHANDFRGRQAEALDVVRRYAEIAPENPHALHMPTHIFVRLGDWPEVVEWNLRAAEAALAQRVGPRGEFVWDEFPHAVEYLVYAYLQQADDAAAERAIRDLEETPDLQASFKTAFHLASTAARFALERRDWGRAAAITPRTPSWIEWDLYRWPEAVSWFARGLGAVHQGEGPMVDESLERLARLESSAADAGEGPFAAQIEILRVELAAWRAHMTGDAPAAVELMRRAIALEEGTPKHPVTPGATLPALELLGDLYLELGEPELALAAYEASDVNAPTRYNTILGLARSSVAVGDAAGARTQYGRLVELARDGADRDGLAEAEAYLRR